VLAVWFLEKNGQISCRGFNGLIWRDFDGVYGYELGL
jgi:hypothetical protein